MVGHYLTHLNCLRQDIKMLKGLNLEDKYGNKDDWSKEYGDKETKAKVLMRILNGTQLTRSEKILGFKSSSSVGLTTGKNSMDTNVT